MFCNQCGVKNDASARFCSSCGARLEGRPTAGPVVDSSDILTPPVPISRYSIVVMTDCGENKMLVIKTIKDTLGIGLAQARKIADNTPSVLAEHVGELQAFSLKSTFTAIGATIEIREE